MCLGQTKLRNGIDESEIVEGGGWEANGLTLILVTSAKSRAEVAGARVVGVAAETLKAVNLVEKLAVVVVMGVERLAVVAQDRKVRTGR